MADYNVTTTKGDNSERAEPGRCTLSQAINMLATATPTKVTIEYEDETITIMRVPE